MANMDDRCFYALNTLHTHYFVWLLRLMEHLFAKILRLQEWLLYFPVIRGPLCIKGCATKAKRNGLSFPRLSRVLKKHDFFRSGYNEQSIWIGSTGTDLQTFTIISLEKSKHFITIFLDVNEMVTKEVGNISIFCSFKLAFQNSSASKGIPSTQLQHNHLHCCLALHKGMGPVVQNLRENMFNNLRNHCNTL